MTTSAEDLGEFNVDSVDRLQFTFTKDGVAWNNIDSVTLTFRKPNHGTTFQRSMTLLSGNVWYYDTLVGDVDEAGAWAVAVTVVDGAITKTYPYAVGFEAFDQPE